MLFDRRKRITFKLSVFSISYSIEESSYCNSRSEHICYGENRSVFREHSVHISICIYKLKVICNFQFMLNFGEFLYLSFII